MRSAASIALHQDVRAPALLMRFGASSSTGQRHAGVFGIAKDFGTTSNDIRSATLKVLQEFCTPRLRPPGKTSPASSSCLDKALYSHIRFHIHLFDSDAASDELRAGRILASDASGFGKQAAFPNVQALIRDKPHASRRRRKGAVEDGGGIIRGGWRRGGNNKG